MSNVQQTYGWQDTTLTEANCLLIPAILKLLPKRKVRILDLGCGNGTLAAALHRQGYDVVALDASVDGIDLARQQFPGIRFETFSIYEESVHDVIGGDYDFVISMEVIEHLYWPRKLLEVGYASLAGGGRMIVTTPYHGYLKNLALSVLDGWDKHFTVGWDGGHIKFFSRKNLKALMLEQGFKGIDFRGLGRVPGLWKSMILTGVK